MKTEKTYKIIPSDLLEMSLKKSNTQNLDPLLYGYQIIMEKFNIPRNGVVHLGGHVGEELPLYAALGFHNVVMVEPLPREFKIMQKNIDEYNNTFSSLSHFLGEKSSMIAHGINCAISDESGIAKIYYTDVSSLSSLTKPLKGAFTANWDSMNYEELSVTCKTLDELISELPNEWKPSDFSYLRMNVQGSELKALTGGTHFLESITLIDLETNTEARYENNPTKDDFDDFLIKQGFTSIFSYSAGPAIANVLYLRTANII